MLDGLGAERVTDWVRDRLFDLIGYRHAERLPTIFTSNLGVKATGAHLAAGDDAVVGERIAWRIMEMADLVELRGANLRARRPDAPGVCLQS